MGGTLLHYATTNGMLATSHMLVVAGAELDSLDKEQNSPLVSAICAFKNDVVRYLIKAGASITLKVPDFFYNRSSFPPCNNYNTKYLTSCHIIQGYRLFC